MPNVRHEESLDGCAVPEIIQTDHTFSPNDQPLEEDEQILKSDGHVCKSQYREDLKVQVR